MGKEYDKLDLISEFRRVRKQETLLYNPNTNGRPAKCSSSKQKDPFNTNCIREKADNIVEYIDSFKPLDLVLFFKMKTEDSGIKYVVSKGRDLGVMSKLQKDFSNEEICVMIEFIFDSDQNYLDPKVTRPTVLISAYQSSIYNDSQLWLDDKYTPKKKKKELQVREWSDNVSGNNNAVIGEWGS